MKKQVIILGAGKIGRGYLADVFSDAGYHLVLINRSAKKADELNAQKKYTLFISGQEGVRRRVIADYEAYSSERDFEQCVEKIRETNYICISLFQTAFASAADLIAEAIRRRRAAGEYAPMNVMFFVNVVYPSDTFRKLLEERLTNAEDRAYLDRYVGLVEALTFRGGFNPTEEMKREDPLCVSAGEGMELPVGDDFVGEPPRDIPGLQLCDRVQGRLVYKIWSANMRHCMVAEMGIYRGYTYIYEGADDAYIRACVDRATEEADFGIMQEFGFAREDLIEDETVRWEALRNHNEKDDNDRVAADPLRKLARNDRHIGPALLCKKNGKIPFFLCRGAAYLLMYDQKKDASSQRMQQMIREKGMEEAIYSICQLDRKVPMEEEIAQLILAQYQEIRAHQA